MIRYLRFNTGSCGGCDHCLSLAPGLQPTSDPSAATLIVLTGPQTQASREALSQALEASSNLPVVALGRCAIDGSPFGKGGLAVASETRVDLRLDGCPVPPEAIAKALRALASGKPEAPEAGQ